MTNKQLFPKLILQLNRLIETGISISLSLLYIKEEKRYCYSLFINNENHEVLFHEYYNINDDDLTEKLQELKQFVDDLFNK